MDFMLYSCWTLCNVQASFSQQTKVRFKSSAELLKTFFQVQY